MCPFSNWIIHPDVFSIDFHTGTLFFGYFGIFSAFKVDKGKSSRSASLSIKNDLNSFNRPIFRENIIQLIFCSVNAQTEHAETPMGLRIIPSAHVTSSTGHGTVRMRSSSITWRSWMGTRISRSFISSDRTRSTAGPVFPLLAVFSVPAPVSVPFPVPVHLFAATRAPGIFFGFVVPRRIVAFMVSWWMVSFNMHDSVVYWRTASLSIAHCLIFYTKD